jgi:hypothetical protein
MSAAQGTNDKLYPARALRRGFEHDTASRAISLRLAPGVIASPEGHVEPLGKAESHEGPPHGARSIDVMDVTVYSQQKHGKPRPDLI